MDKKAVIDRKSLQSFRGQQPDYGQSLSFPYNETLQSVMQSDVFTCRAGDTVKNVLQEMARRNISSVVVVDPDGLPVGILTERDVMQRLVVSSKFDGVATSVAEVMTADPVCLNPEHSIYRALSLLSASGVKHLPLVANKKVAGIVTMRQLLKLRHPEPISLIEKIASAQNYLVLKDVFAQMPDIARNQLDSGRHGYDIVSMMSLINQDIHRRVFELIRNEMGEPPVPFCMYVTGSHGRQENLLAPDQDHGMIIADSPQEYQYDEYFVEYSTRVSEMLDQIGYVFCPGNIMCSNPLWRKSLSEWRVQIKYWFDTQVRELGRFCTVLFDAAPIYGEISLFDEMQTFSYQIISRHREALIVIHEEMSRHQVPLRWPGRFVTEKFGDHRRELELKRSGLIFIVEGVRLLALMQGIRQTSTLKRIDILVKEGSIHPDDGEYLQASYHFIIHLALRAQLNKIAKGKIVDSFIDPEKLSRRKRENLRHAFRAVRNLQEMVGAEFGDLVI